MNLRHYNVEAFQFKLGNILGCLRIAINNNNNKIYVSIQ